MQNYNGMIYRQYFSEIYATQNLYKKIKSTLNALRLIFSEIGVLLWKWRPFFQIAYKQWHDIFGNTFSEICAPKTYRVDNEGSTLLRFGDMVTGRPFFKMAASAPTGEICLGTIEKYTCFRIVHVCQVSCFYHKMQDFALICWTTWNILAFPLVSMMISP